MQVEINEKAQYLLKTLVEHYIESGHPVGSKTLAECSEISVSPATVRNVMAGLEELGFLESPHTSAGRIPTGLGYRFFVDSLVTVEPLATLDMDNLTKNLNPDMSVHQLVESASGLLSEITNMTGLVTVPNTDQTHLRHVEFLGLNDNRVLVILVLDDHEVQNRVIYTKETNSEEQLKAVANFINQNYVGQALSNIRSKLIRLTKNDQENMDSLMYATLEVAEQAFGTKHQADFVVAGQENLIELAEEQALADIRELFKAFSLKRDILHLLDKCVDTQGVKLFIGAESGYQILDECTLVTAPYQADGEHIGVLGVLGPTRMAYDRVIPIVDATARLLGAAMDYPGR